MFLEAWFFLTEANVLDIPWDLISWWNQIGFDACEE
jgi:hypothetical protein